MKIDLERQMDSCRRVSAEVLAGAATLEQLCIDTRGLLYMAEVVMASMSSIMTEKLTQLVREVLEGAAKAAKARAEQQPQLGEDEKESGRRVIGRVKEFDSAWEKHQAAVRGEELVH